MVPWNKIDRIQAENDVVRTKARQDVDQLLGKGAKSESKSGKSKSSSSKKEIPETKLSIAPLADKKALPGIRGKVCFKNIKMLVLDINNFE